MFDDCNKIIRFFYGIYVDQPQPAGCCPPCWVKLASRWSWAQATHTSPYTTTLNIKLLGRNLIGGYNNQSMILYSRILFHFHA